jgi:hypothetical protein
VSSASAQCAICETKYGGYGKIRTERKVPNFKLGSLLFERNFKNFSFFNRSIDVTRLPLLSFTPLTIGGVGAVDELMNASWTTQIDPVPPYHSTVNLCHVDRDLTHRLSHFFSALIPRDGLQYAPKTGFLCLCEYITCVGANKRPSVTGLFPMRSCACQPLLPNSPVCAPPSSLVLTHPHTPHTRLSLLSFFRVVWVSC